MFQAFSCVKAISVIAIFPLSSSCFFFSCCHFSKLSCLVFFSFPFTCGSPYCFLLNLLVFHIQRPQNPIYVHLEIHLSYPLVNLFFPPFWASLFHQVLKRTPSHYSCLSELNLFQYCYSPSLSDFLPAKFWCVSVNHTKNKSSVVSGKAHAHFLKMCFPQEKQRHYFKVTNALSSHPQLLDHLW